MARHNWGKSPKPWSKLKSRIESLFAPNLELAIHCNVFVKVTMHDTWDEPRHWMVLGRGASQKIIWDFPGPFLRPSPDQPPRSTRGPPLEHFEAGYRLSERQPSVPSATIRDYLDRPREQLMEPFDDPWELAAILRAADARLGRRRLLEWGETLDGEHPAWKVLGARFGPVNKLILSRLTL